MAQRVRFDRMHHHPGSHDPVLVALSILIAALASYTALDLATRMRAASGSTSLGWLVAAAAAFGRTTRIPTLWIYSENDTYFAPHLSGAMAEAFRAAGGPVDYTLLPAFGDDGHFMAERAGSDSVWGPVVERFLARLR